MNLCLKAGNYSGKKENMKYTLINLCAQYY